MVAMKKAIPTIPLGRLPKKAVLFFALIYLAHQILQTPSNSPLQGGELRLPPLQGGTEGGKNLHGVPSILTPNFLWMNQPCSLNWMHDRLH